LRYINYIILYKM